MASALVLLAISFIHLAAAQSLAPINIAEQYDLATSTSLPFPSATASTEDTQSRLISGWSLGRGRIQDGADNLEFVDDPYPSTGASSGPVLRVTYPQGSYSHNTGGGAQFYNLWNITDDTTFGSMMVSYEMALERGFNWVKGGKLPGLRGGFNSTGCSGGRLANGKDCFSARVMWRRSGSGEVYAYIPRSNGVCSRRDVDCNDDFGISFDRGSFVMRAGQWMEVAMLVRLNSPPDVANGNIRLYFNGQEVLSQEGLQIRSADSVTVNGLFFSTFFGGADESFATPRDTFSYFRNIQLWGSTQTSNLTGPVIESSALSAQSFSFTSILPATLAFLLL
ncbi:hypothetical protein BKA70DRAFT_1095664 [Coprinopsis sp. MPI-PUGE-AT-0042]|nr:hypothetical protein BKA70DRAFT_1095664 [Coprinopsis sp. MPI-PUGE-AT-0042]